MDILRRTWDVLRMFVLDIYRKFGRGILFQLLFSFKNKGDKEKANNEGKEVLT